MNNRFEIGNITSGYRPIKNGLEYNSYFPKPDERDRVIIEDGEVDQTVDLMKKVVWKYLNDTKKIAPILKGSTTLQTCNNIWNFLYHHIQYRLDKKGLEQLRRPARSWQERTEGIDCDCFSIFISSILTNLGIQHSFRITKYGGDVFQHVYVIVHEGNKTHIIDPVLSKANYEKTYTEKKDFNMSLEGINVAVLSGTTEQDLYDAVLATDLDGLGLGSMDEQQEIDGIYRHILATRNAVAQNPDMISLVDDPNAFLKMLDYAIKHWNTPNRDKALEILAQNEDKLNLQNGISGLEDELEDDDDLLGRLFKKRKKKGRVKGFFRSVKKAVKNPGKTLKKYVKTLVRFNPLVTASRNGFLLALKLNVKKMSSRLKWAYATKEQAAKKGISEAKWNQTKSALVKIEKIFADKLQGKRSSIKKAILKSKAGNLNGVVEDCPELAYLGEPVSAAALIASATPVIITVIQVMKKSGIMDKNESEVVNLTEDDIKSGASKSGQQDYVSQNDDSDDSSDFDYDDDTNGDDPKPKNPTITFLKNNPMVAVGGIAALGGIGYMIFGKKKDKGSLKGADEKKTQNKKKQNKKKKSPTKKKKSPQKLKKYHIKLIDFKTIKP